MFKLNLTITTRRHENGSASTVISRIFAITIKKSWSLLQYETNITQLKSHWKHYVCKWKMLIQKHFLPSNNATSFKQCVTLFIHYNIVVCNKTGFIACSETTLAWCFSECSVLVTENEGLIPVGHPAALLYPGSVCWKVWMIQTSLNKQISPKGKYEKYRQTSAPQLEKWVLIAALKDGLFCAETAAPTWSMINVVMPRLFSSCEALLS